MAGQHRRSTTADTWAANAIDGAIGGEWASKGELNPWLRLDWNGNQTVTQVVLYDRVNSADWAPGGTLSFSDGSSVDVSGIPNDGSAHALTFPAKTVTWVKFQVSGGSGSNVDLSEIQVF